MTCADWNWKDFVLGEVPAKDRPGMERHLAGCEECRREVESLQATLVALRRLPAQEPPRRIAFVSDPVFETTWWQRFWASGPKLAFASSAMLSAALLVHAFLPARPPDPPQSLSEARLEERVRQEVAARLPVAVRETVKAELQPALSELSTRIDQLDKTRLASVERRVDEQRKSDLKNLESAFTYIEKRINTLMTSNVRYGGD